MISVVMPTYNETENLLELLEGLDRVLAGVVTRWSWLTMGAEPGRDRGGGQEAETRRRQKLGVDNR